MLEVARKGLVKIAKKYENSQFLIKKLTGNIKADFEIIEYTKSYLS